MTNDDYKIIEQAMKSMKRDIFVLTPFYVLGTDKEYTDLVVVEMDTKIRPDAIYMLTLEVVTFIAKNDVRNIELYLDTYCMKIYGKNILLEKLNKVSSIKAQCPVTMDTGELKDNTEFMNIINSKASAGSQFFRLSQTVIMSIFKGLLPINSPDKVKAIIYSELNTQLSLAEYIIDKKKFCLHIFVEYLNI